MTQSQIIDKLNDLMPEIVSTRNPKGVMLKWAKANNLSPALLERTGHVFNTAKTLWALEKSANRGDSFPIVDIPEMMEAYQTYTPDKELSKDEEKVHAQVRNLTKGASGFQSDSNLSSQYAGGIQPGMGLEDIHRIMYEHRDVEYQDADADDWMSVPLAKAAAVQAQPQMEKAAWERRKELEEARRNVEAAVIQSEDFIFEKCAEVRQIMLGNLEKWGEAKEDIVDTYGDAGKAVVQTLEQHFRNKGLVFASPDLDKRACVRALVQDRHSILKVTGEMAEALQIHQECQELLMEKKAVDFQNDFRHAAVANLPKKLLERLTLNPSRFVGGAIDPTLTVGDLSPDEFSLAGRWYDSEMKDPDPPAGLEMGKYVSHKELEKKDVLADGAKDLISSMTSAHNIVPSLVPAADSMIDRYKSIVNEFRPRTDERTRTVDAAKTKATSETTLQQLLLSDPILAERDPKRVQTLYNAIAKLSPTLAASPEMMGPALKEAIQYESLPLHLVKSYVDFEKSMAEAEEKKMKTDQMKY